MNLNIFNGNNLFESAAGLFEQLGIKLNSNTETALQAKAVLGEYFKDRTPFTDIQKVYFAGLVDDSVFGEQRNITVEQALARAGIKYNGFMIFALEISIKPT
ncbi:MAG: hypothetical protein LBB88_12320, partial [Planctomycetaceae bacterium]|nr:hypothetical protein [Planctomycetaceae bacterium]